MFSDSFRGTVTLSTTMTLHTKPICGILCLGTSTFVKTLSISAAELGWCFEKRQKISKIGKRRKKVICTSEHSKHAFKTATLEKLATNPKKIYTFLKIANLFWKFCGISHREMCVVYFLDISCSICWLNTCISHKKLTTKACIIGAKVIEIAIFGAFRLSRKLMSLFMTCRN